MMEEIKTQENNVREGKIDKGFLLFSIAGVVAAIVILGIVMGFKAKFIIENKSEELHEAKVVETEAFVHRRRNEAYSAILSYDENGETKLVKTDFCFNNKRILDKGTVYIKKDVPVYKDFFLRDYVPYSKTAQSGYIIPLMILFVSGYLMMINIFNAINFDEKTGGVILGCLSIILGVLVVLLTTVDYQIICAFWGSIPVAVGIGTLVLFLKKHAPK